MQRPRIMRDPRFWLAPAAVALCVAASAQSPQPPLELQTDGRFWTARVVGEGGVEGPLEIDTKGQVVVRGADREGIRHTLTMRLLFPDDEEAVRRVLGTAGTVERRRPDGSVVLSLREPDCQGCRFGARLEVEVPASMNTVSILTRLGGIDVRNVAGSVQAVTLGGSIALDAIGGNVRAATDGGSIQIGTVGGSVDCVTEGGSIRLARAAGPAQLKTRGGFIRVAAVGGRLDAETAAGSIEVGRADGAVRVSTGAGSIRVKEARRRVHAESKAGRIRIDRAMGALTLSNGEGDILAGFQRGASMEDSVLETSVGSIVVSLPETLATTIDASVQLARGLQGIVSEFPSVMVRRSENRYGPKSAEAAGAINGGGATLRLRNGVGRIEVKRIAVKKQR